MKQYLSIPLIVIALVALAALTYVHFEQNRVVPAKQTSVHGNGNISVGQASNTKLSTSTYASSTPPASNGSAAAKASDLQSNVNINDPSLASNSLVKSVNGGSSQ